ncbi:hypothetical protein LJC63_10725, partial [Ruminococcaceae bacterium OttesenSCG-928-L11]|nr:hypothetical protein [Ruminococcaceae bacterium OttesenSCG-928-L11]
MAFFKSTKPDLSGITAEYEQKLKSMETHIQALARERDAFKAENDRLTQEIRHLSAEVDLKRSNFLKYYNMEMKLLRMELEGCKAKNEELEQQLQAGGAAPRPHNERGAGRKSRATPEILQTIRELREDGSSLQAIATALEETTGQS